MSWTKEDTFFQGKPVYSVVAGDNTIFAGLSNGDILRSTDNGVTWTELNTGLSSGIIMTIAVTGSTVFAGTSDDGLLCSTDNGDTWTTINSGLPSDMYFFALAIQEATLFGGSAYDGLWQLPIPDMVGVTPRNQKNAGCSMNMAADILPACHPDGTVSFSLSHPEHVTITITDLSGREAGTIVNSKLIAGNYRCRWATDGLTPGCYVIKVRTGTDLVIMRSPIIR